LCAGLLLPQTGGVGCGSLIESEVFVGVAHCGEVLLEVLKGDDDGAAAVVGVEGERLVLGLRVVLVVEQCCIEEEMDVVLCVVDEAEGRDAARLEPQILHHALGRGKGEFAARGLALGLQGGFEASLQVVDVEVMVAMEADEVVLVALVVAHEDVLAVHGAVVLPPAFGLLDGLALGVLVAGEWDMVCLQVAEDRLGPLGCRGCLFFSVRHSCSWSVLSYVSCLAVGLSSPCRGGVALPLLTKLRFI